MESTTERTERTWEEIQARLDAAVARLNEVVKELQTINLDLDLDEVSNEEEEQ